MNFRNAVLTLLFSGAVFYSTAQKVAVVKYPELEKSLVAEKGQTLVVNFWATWCIPCITELPDFEKLQKKYPASQVRVVLVSLDYKAQLDKKVIPFLSKTKIGSPALFLLDETDPNTWMNKLDPDWSGALPFTLVIRAGGVKKGFERTFTLAELKKEIQSLSQ